MAEASVVVLDQPIGTISPRLYGHFAEHLGRCCYGGLWADGGEGDRSKAGFRADAVEALRELGAPLGGCLASPLRSPLLALAHLFVPHSIDDVADRSFEHRISDANFRGVFGTFPLHICIRLLCRKSP